LRFGNLLVRGAYPLVLVAFFGLATQSRASTREAAFEAFRTGAWEQAVQLFEEHLRLSPQDGEALQTLGYIYYKAEEFSKAKNRFEQAVATGHETAYVISMLGNIAFKQLDPGGACKLYEQAVALDRDDSSLQENLHLVEKEIERIHELVSLRDRCAGFYWGSLVVVGLLLAAGLWCEVRVRSQ